MAIGNDFNSLQAAILAEDRLKLDDKIAFRNYLVQQAQNRNQGRQVGVNQYDAETRRGLGFRNADETAAERDARYGFLDRELLSREGQAKTNADILREQILQRQRELEADRDLQRWKATLQDNQIFSDMQLRGELGRGQLDMYGKQLEAGRMPTEAFSAKAAELVAAEEDKERRGSVIAEALNNKTRAGTGMFTSVESARDKAFNEISSGPLGKDISLVRFDQATQRYVPAVNASELRRALMEARNPRASGQSVTIEPPKAPGADFTATRVNGRWQIGGNPDEPLTKGPYRWGNDDPAKVYDPSSGVARFSPEEAAGLSSVLNGGAPGNVPADAVQLMQSNRDPALEQEFRRRLTELERTPSGAAPILAPLYSDIGRRMSLDPARVGGSTMFRTPQNHVRGMANSEDVAAWEAGLTPDQWRALIRGAIAESYRNPTRGYDNYVIGQ